MRETKFIEQNKEKWAEYEELLKQKRRDPDKMNELFIKITDDLSYARTFYPNRSVRVYLNELAKRIFHQLYEGKHFPWHRIKHFWTEDIPTAFWEARKAFLLSFGIFLLAVLIGVVSSKLNPGFAVEILGAEYVAETLANIEKGDPMAIYKDKEVLGMSVGIAFNNLWVAFLTLVLGVLGSVGTIFILLRNGVMLGVFQYFFVERGLFWDSFLTIWIHGTLEIAAIVIAGGAGLIAGSGLLFPGTYTRGQALQLSIRRGLLIFIGIAPLIVMAALFEGFLTRFTETPDVVRGGFILVSFLFVVWYFVYFPYMHNRKGIRNVNIFRELPAEHNEELELNAIKNTSTILGETILVLGKKGAAFFASMAAGAFMLTLAFAFATSLRLITYRDNFRAFPRDFMEIRDILSVEKMPLGWIVSCVLVFSAFNFFVHIRLRRVIQPHIPAPSANKQILFGVMSVVSSLLFVYFLQLENIWFCLVSLLMVVPVVLVYNAFCNYSEENPIAAMGKLFGVFPFLRGFATMFIVLFFGMVIFLFMQTSVFELLIEMINLSIPTGQRSTDTGSVLFRAVKHFFSFFALLFIYGVSIIMATLLYFSGREEKEANALFDRIDQIGEIKKIRGLSRE